MKADVDRNTNDHKGLFTWDGYPTKSAELLAEMVRFPPTSEVLLIWCPPHQVEQLGASKCCCYHNKHLGKIAFCVRRERAALTSADGYKSLHRQPNPTLLQLEVCRNLYHSSENRNANKIVSSP